MMVTSCLMSLSRFFSRPFNNCRTAGLPAIQTLATELELGTLSFHVHMLHHHARLHLLGCFWFANLISYEMLPFSIDLILLSQSFIEDDIKLSKWTVYSSNSRTFETWWIANSSNIKSKLRSKWKKNTASSRVTSNIFYCVLMIFDSKWI